MGLWKSLAERMREKRDELARKALKKAAETAVDSAGKAVGSVSKAIGRAFFGEEESDVVKSDKPEPPDPFAKLKAAEAQRKERERK
jgi:hypothetical protein